MVLACEIGWQESHLHVDNPISYHRHRHPSEPSATVRDLLPVSDVPRDSSLRLSENNFTVPFTQLTELFIHVFCANLVEHHRKGKVASHQ